MTLRQMPACRLLGLTTGFASARDQVVHHVSDTEAQALGALRKLRVHFEVCEITLKHRNLKKEPFLQDADFTPSGVVRITRLQHPGHAGLRP